MMTLTEAMERIADLEARVAFMHREFERTIAVLTECMAHAGRELTAPEPEPMGQLLAFRVPKNVAGSAAPRAASRHGSTTGRAS